MIRRKLKTARHTSLRFDVVDGAFRRYPDGREVCLDNKAGKEEYRQRTMAMVIRQNYICSRGEHRIVLPTFDHSTSGRGMGSVQRSGRIKEAVMAYFSNGTEGMSYEEQYCNRCVFNEDCPVLMLHMLWNYEQHGDDETAKAKKTALDMLIPRDKQGWNEKCKMFILRTEPLPLFADSTKTA